VPIVRGERVFCVLTVQTEPARPLRRREEEEALATIAMGAGRSCGTGNARRILIVEIREGGSVAQCFRRRFTGECLAEGLVHRTAFLHEPRVRAEPGMIRRRSGRGITASGTGARRDAALSRCDARILRTRSRGETREVIEAYRMFAHDQGWRTRLIDAVRTGLTAEAAVERVQDETPWSCESIGPTIPICAAACMILTIWRGRLLRHLVLSDYGAIMRRSLPMAVVIARAMGPAELLDTGATALPLSWSKKQPIPRTSPSFGARSGFR